MEDVRVTTFVKAHGLGNDYLVLRESAIAFPLTPDAIRRLCDRHRGVGSDGVLLEVESRVAEFGVRIFNPDGSEAEKSGNGLRIFAKFLVDHGLARGPAFDVETRGGVVACRCRLTGGRVTAVTVEMGRATFRASEIPMRGPDADAVEVPLVVDDRILTVTAVSVGNPHCVVFVDRLDDDELRRLGPLVERHPDFPNRTNVQLARVEARDRVAIRIWERGAGHTLASGSSSCAVAVAAVRTGRCDHGRVTVVMPGGELVVDVRADWALTLDGPVEEVCTGVISADLLAALQ
jgi:diaminopimelate epimerase